MAGNLIDLRRRINSVRDTQKITKAMKTVSAAKLRRYVNELNRNRTYNKRLNELLVILQQQQNGQKNLFWDFREEGETVVIIISADKGLCGAFNTNIIRHALEYLQCLEGKKEHFSVVLVGNKAVRFFKKKEYPIRKEFANMMSKLSLNDAVELSHYLQNIYTSAKIKKIECLYSRFISAGKQEISSMQLFPLTFTPTEIARDERDDIIEYILEPDVQRLIDYLLPRYIPSTVYDLLLETVSSEQAARMVAMELASKNADDMVRSLILMLNKLRQALITKELLEIITATEALKK